MKKAILAIILLCLAGGAAWFWLKASEEGRIRKKFDKLAESISKEKGEGNILMVCKMQALGSLFADSCDVDIPKSSLSGTYSPEEIVSNATRARMHFSSMDLKFYDIKIVIVSENKAEVVFTGRLCGTAAEDKSADEIRELDATMDKVDGEWRFSSFKVVEVLEK